MADTTETTEQSNIEQPKLFKEYNEELIFRKNLDRPLTADEVDSNFFKTSKVVYQMFEDVTSFHGSLLDTIIKNNKEELTATVNAQIQKNSNSLEKITDGLKANVQELEKEIKTINSNIDYQFEIREAEKPSIFIIPFARFSLADNKSPYLIRQLFIDLILTVTVDGKDYTEIFNNAKIVINELEKDKPYTLATFFKFEDNDGDYIENSIYALLNDDSIVLYLDVCSYVDKVQVGYKCNPLVLPLIDFSEIDDVISSD